MKADPLKSKKHVFPFIPFIFPADYINVFKFAAPSPVYAPVAAVKVGSNRILGCVGARAKSRCFCETRNVRKPRNVRHIENVSKTENKLWNKTKIN